VLGNNSESTEINRITVPGILYITDARIRLISQLFELSNIVLGVSLKFRLTFWTAEEIILTPILHNDMRFVSVDTFAAHRIFVVIFCFHLVMSTILSIRINLVPTERRCILSFRFSHPSKEA
jgi:hypothetical protein